MNCPRHERVRQRMRPRSALVGQQAIRRSASAGVVRVDDEASLAVTTARAAETRHDGHRTGSHTNQGRQAERLSTPRQRHRLRQPVVIASSLPSSQPQAQCPPGQRCRDKLLQVGVGAGHQQGHVRTDWRNSGEATAVTLRAVQPPGEGSPPPFRATAGAAQQQRLRHVNGAGSIPLCTTSNGDRRLASGAFFSSWLTAMRASV